MYNINKDMNTIKDFQKKPSGAVVNINSNDHARAKKRNYVKRVQDNMFGAENKEGAIDKVVRYQDHDHKSIRELKDDIKELKALVNKLVGEK